MRFPHSDRSAHADVFAEQAHWEMEERLCRIGAEGSPAIERRLRLLDEEWTAGRVAKVIMGAAMLPGLILGAIVSPWWLLIPGLVGLLLLQHAIAREDALTRGLRALGVRGAIEIEHERCALKVMRGDFRYLHPLSDHEDEDAIARLEGEGGLPIPESAAEADENVRTVVKDVLEVVEESR
jgi:hypothetical protein